MELPSQVAEHVETIAKHEQDFLASRTLPERLADRVASFAGRLMFVLVQLAISGVWVVWNSTNAISRHHFDPYPYAFFNALVALEAILLASFILMRQSNLARRADERDHLMLQILLLTEKEVSAVVRMNQQMAAHSGLREISRDEGIKEMGEPTSIDQVAQTIQEKFSADQS